MYPFPQAGEQTWSEISEMALNASETKLNFKICYGVPTMLSACFLEVIVDGVFIIDIYVQPLTYMSRWKSTKSATYNMGGPGLLKWDGCDILPFQNLVLFPQVQNKIGCLWISILFLVHSW